MSYSAPAGGAVDFIQAGISYTPPVGGSVAFSWVSGDPTYHISGSSSIGFIGGWLLLSVATISASSSFNPEHPYRAFSIPSGSAAAFDTWQRAFAFQSLSDPVFRAGVIARIASGSVASVFGHGLLRGAFAINSASLVDGRDQWIQNIVFSNDKSKTVARFAGAYNKDTAMRIFGASAFATSPRAVKRSAFNFSPHSSGAFSSATIRRSAFSMSSGGATAAAGRATARAVAASFGQSAFTPYGRPALGGAALISSYSVASFTSSFDFSVIEAIPEDADVAYCVTRPHTVRVLTA